VGVVSRKIMETILDTAKGLYEAGVMSDKTLHEFEKLCKLTKEQNSEKPD